MLGYILSGGYIMFPLVFLSVLAVAVIIERLRVFRMAQVDTFKLRQDVNNSLIQGDLNQAVKRCQSCSGPVAAVLLVGLDKYRRMLVARRSLAEIETSVSKTMEDYAPRALGVLENRVNLLTLIASVSPLLGMTGTVTGMISAFNQMVVSGVDASGVAGGISEALITTAAGLLIAIPSLVAHNVFAKRVDRFVLEIEETMTELLDFITLGADKASA